jgi:hypothetical protein
MMNNNSPVGVNSSKAKRGPIFERHLVSTSLQRED